jgi:hypothetical protein
MMTSWSGFWYGRGRSSTALATLKMAVLAPTPKAIVSAAVSAKIGLFRSVRPANRSSRNDIFAPGRSAMLRGEYHFQGKLQKCLAMPESSDKNQASKTGLEHPPRHVCGCRWNFSVLRCTLNQEFRPKSFSVLLTGVHIGDIRSGRRRRRVRRHGGRIHRAFRRRGGEWEKLLWDWRVGGDRKRSGRVAWWPGPVRQTF